MLLTSAVWCLATLSLFTSNVLASPVAASDLDFEDELDRLLEGRQASNGFFPVTGISGTVHPRLEIRTMYNSNPNQWNLYLLALQQFQNVNQDKKLSFYQIAGIHGVPNVAWDGVTANPYAGGVGYCTHDSVLFPAWHRPFVALYEEIFMRHVKKIVNSFPAGSTRDMYASAAATMRIPYWDWAAAPPSGTPTFPLVFTAQYATVRTAKGQKTIPNPLYQYNFHPLNPSDMIYAPWAQWSTTMRWPTTNTTGATSQENQAQAAVENGRINLRDTLYTMFVNCGDYLGMSNDARGSSSPSCSTSLEGIHNGIHGLVGGDNDGHMSVLWYSAFDPVFWLHHANVDRLFAMWQTVHPSSYGAYQNAQGSTYTIQQGTSQGPNSPLTPFHSDTSGAFWTTNGVRDWRVFGYTYPEYVDSDGSASSIRNYINNLYGPSASGTAGSSKAKRALDLDLSQPLPPAILSKTRTKSGATYEYAANIAAPRFALGGSYNVFIFMGGPSDPSDASQWLFDKNLIGSVNVFSQPHMEHNSVVTTGSVPLTRALTSVLVDDAPVNGVKLADLDKSSVVPFLQKALVWRVATAKNQIIDPDDIPGFEVSVVTSHAQPANSANEFPSFSPFNILPDVTHGKKGGLKIGAKSACDSRS